MAIGGEAEHWAECLSEGRRIFRSEVFDIGQQKLRIKAIEEQLNREKLELVRKEEELTLMAKKQYNAAEILDARCDFSTKLSKI